MSDGLRESSVEERSAEEGVSERGDVPPSIVLVVVGGISRRGKEWVDDFVRSIDVELLLTFETSTAIGIVMPNASCSSSSALLNASAPFSALRSSSARSNLSTSLVRSRTSPSALLLAFLSSATILFASSNSSTDRFSSSPIKSSFDFCNSAFLETSVAEEEARAVLEERRAAWDVWRAERVDLRDRISDWSSCIDFAVGGVRDESESSPVEGTAGEVPMTLLSRLCVDGFFLLPEMLPRLKNPPVFVSFTSSPFVESVPTRANSPDPRDSCFEPAPAKESESRRRRVSSRKSECAPASVRFD